MRPLAGLGLQGPAYIAKDRRTRLGEPHWGPAELLRDLQLPLGLGRKETPRSDRVQKWAGRMRTLADARASYAPSFQVDPLGTAEPLLGWRDDLVEAGWNGAAFPDAGDRLALHAVESHAESAVPLGVADRVARIERELKLGR